MRSTFMGMICLFLNLFVLLMPQGTEASSIEDEVRTFFEDIPVMVAIADCESAFRQFGNDGLPLRGGWGGGMVGVFQIFEEVHSKAATAQGFDLDTVEGNLKYAKHLYATQGTTPWDSGRSCWEKKEVRKNEASADLRLLEEKIVHLQKLVVQLQILLEKKKAILNKTA